MSDGRWFDRRRGPHRHQYVLKGDPTNAFWVETASFIVEVSPNLKPLKVHRLRQHGADYPLVRYFSADELKRLFKPIKAKR